VGCNVSSTKTQPRQRCRLPAKVKPLKQAAVCRCLSSVFIWHFAGLAATMSNIQSCKQRMLRLFQHS
jgi:hypothetical protein